MSYHFNGKEKDDDWTGNSGDSYDFGARMYDSRLGRWWSTDPKEREFPHISTYSSFGGNPVMYIDINGEVVVDPAARMKRAIKVLDPKIDKMKSKSDKEGFEYGAIITKVDLVSYDLETRKFSKQEMFELENERTDESPDYVTFNTDVELLEIGRIHTHPDKGQTFSPTDVTSMRQHVDKVGYFSVVDAGNKRYGLVIEDSEKAKKFFANNPDLENKIETSAARYRAEEGLSYEESQKKAVITTLKDSGIGYYETNDTEKTNFIKKN